MNRYKLHNAALCEGSEMPERHHDGTKVRINKPALREHGVVGTVQMFDAETGWYWVELDKGPPWRGKYEQSELLPHNVELAGEEDVSDVMLLGVLRMPMPDDPDPITLRQFVLRARQAADEIVALRAVAEKMDAVIESAATQFVRGEDVAAIDEWHRMAAEARAEYARMNP